MKIQHIYTAKHSTNHAESKYKHSLTFRVWRYVVIATKPVHKLQIRPTLHNYSPKLHLGPCSSVGMWQETDRQTHTQTAVTNIHFTSAMPHMKYKNALSLPI